MKPSARVIFLLLAFASLGGIAGERAVPMEIDGGTRSAWHQLSALTFQDVDGKPMTLGALRGKAVIVDMWATWCAPCLNQLPALHRMHNRYKSSDRVAIVTLNVDQDFGKATRYLNKHAYSFPTYKAFAEVEKAFGGQIRLPRTWIVGTSGQLVREVRDDTGDATFQRTLEAVLDDLVAK